MAEFHIQMEELGYTEGGDTGAASGFQFTLVVNIAAAHVTAALQRVDNQMTCLSYLVVGLPRLTHSSNRFVVEGR